MDIPLITLDAEDRANLRDCLATALGNPASTPLLPPLSTMPFPDLGNAPIADAPLLHAHLGTLDKILATHEEIMHALIGRANDPAMPEAQPK